MSTTTFLYLINTLSTFSFILTGVFIISIVALIIIIIASYTTFSDYISFCLDLDQYNRLNNLNKKMRKYAIIFVSISTIGIIFIPSKKELLTIYGVGTSIEYLKQNETAKQLPDKAIIAIDKWLSTEASDSSNNK